MQKQVAEKKNITQENKFNNNRNSNNSNNNRTNNFNNRNNNRNNNGFKLELTTTETTIIKKKICQIIQNLKIKEYCDLLDYFEDIGDNDFWEIASNHTYFFDKYICSLRNKEKYKEK